MSKNILLGQQAYEQIRQRIIALDLAPGSVIDEAELQGQMELGRTPIREALKRLALEGLVNIVPRRGIFVADIGLDDLQRLQEVRLVLETLAVRLAAQRGKAEHWRQLEALLDQEALAGEANSATLIEADAAFHETVYRAADNQYLHDALTVLLGLNERLWYYFLPDANGLELMSADHRALAMSLQARDEVQAEAIMVRHIRRVQESVRQQILESFAQS